MSLRIAQRQEDFYDFEKCVDYVINPEWMCAPLELIDLRLDHDGSDCHVVGPYRFRGKDIEQAKNEAKNGNWEGLRKLSIPQRIPPKMTF